MESVDLTYVETALAKCGRERESVIPILQSLQEHYGYLPESALRRVCELSEITPSSISGVSTFYDMFRHSPVGRVIVRVCRGTACHVTGAERVEDALRLRLQIPEGKNTDVEREYTVESVACLGCCTLAPVVRMDQTTYGHVNGERVSAILRDFASREESNPRVVLPTPVTNGCGNGSATITVGLGSCCVAKGSDRLFEALQQSVRQTGANVSVKRVGCVGMCHRTPLIEVATPGKASAVYAGLVPEQMGELVSRHFPSHGLLSRALHSVSGAVSGLFRDGPDAVSGHSLSGRDPAVRSFFGKQVHIATEHFGRVDPLDLDEFLENDGFTALRSCLTGRSGEEVIQAVEQSGLRGRGGAGFPSGPKWRCVSEQPDPVKYVICNGDEGDPGAFMDRMLLESFPFRILEGAAIAAVAVGAHDVIFYIRQEYPLAVERVRAAIRMCEERGWLGERLMDHDYPLRVSVKEGAGAFVCGEETALIASLEGHRGMPRLRPPFPAQSGLLGKPTLINNVETLAAVSWILRHGPEAYAAYGTARSKGTKVFALAGKVQRGGLIEVPMGTTIRQIVEEIGGGARPGHVFKAVQIGGPSGGCVPARLADTPVDYDSLREVGAIMGSGGLVVLDDSDCMVDIARYFLQFTQNQSCGKCTFCRVGTRRMLDILERICAGKGHEKDLDELEHLSRWVSQGSLCGLGKTAPNPVFTTLRYFRDEYAAHLQGRCPAGRCRDLISYRVSRECTGCTLCAQHCPVGAIPMTPYEKHEINLELCTRCDSCRQVCPSDAVEVF